MLIMILTIEKALKTFLDMDCGRIRIIPFSASCLSKASRLCKTSLAYCPPTSQCEVSTFAKVRRPIIIGSVPVGSVLVREVSVKTDSESRGLGGAQAAW